MISRKMKVIVDFLNQRFVYKADGKRDKWIFMKPADKMYGDCEDYSLFIAKELSGSLLKFHWNVITRKFKFYHVETKPKGEGHLIFNYGDYWIDNWTTRWVDREHMENLFDIKYRCGYPEILYKLFIGKIYAD